MQISSRAVMFWGCRWATRTFNSLQRFSMGLRSGDWLGHSRTLKCFLRSHSFVAREVCLGSLSCWKTQPRFIFNALADGRRFSLKISRYMAPFILSFTQISRPGPFAEKQPQSMMFPPPCFTVGMVFFGCNSAFFLLQTRQVEFLPKSYILVSSDHMTFSQSSSGSSKCSLANFRRAWTCTGLSRGTRLALQDLSPWRRSVLLMVAFVTLVPALCRSFTRSPPCGSGIFAHSSCDHFDPTGWDLAWSPRSREIISGLVCLPFSNNCSHSWFLHIKLRTYCRFSLPSLVQVYNFVSGVLWQLFGLGHSGVWSVTVWGCGQVSFILITSSNRCH